MKKTLIYILDRIFECIFGILGAFALYGVYKGAIWQLFFAAICAVIALAAHANAEKEREGNGYEKV